MTAKTTISGTWKKYLDLTILAVIIWRNSLKSIVPEKNGITNKLKLTENRIRGFIMIRLCYRI
jgi:hypothetical protein